jgi:hypothetical protein
MYGPEDPRPVNQSAADNLPGSSKKRLPFATTAEIRAFLTDLKMRPYRQRQILCRMLRRAASQATTADSVVDPVVSHPTTAT